LSPLPPSCDNSRDHFSGRAALVIEEARQSLADSVRLLREDIAAANNVNASVRNNYNATGTGTGTGNGTGRNRHGSNQFSRSTNANANAFPRHAGNARHSRQQSNSNNNNNNHHHHNSYNHKQCLHSMNLTVTRVEHKGNSGHSIVTFSKQHTQTHTHPTAASFTRDELFHLRLGTIFGCLDGTASHNRIENVILGVILPQSRDEMIQSNSFVVMIFRKIKKPPTTASNHHNNHNTWRLTPIVSLLSEQRKFEACMHQMTAPVPFLLPLLGRKKPTHVARHPNTPTIRSDTNNEHAAFDANRQQQQHHHNYGRIVRRRRRRCECEWRQ